MISTVTGPLTLSLAVRRQVDHFSGAHRFPADPPLAFDRDEQLEASRSRWKLRYALDSFPYYREMGAGHKLFAARRLPCSMRLATGDRQPVIEMKFAWAAVVVQAVGNVGVLLDLAQHQPGADGMDGARRKEKCVPRLGWVCFEKIQSSLRLTRPVDVRATPAREIRR